MFQGDQWRLAVARVWSERDHDADRYLGTAFFVNDRYLLTARHVLENEASARLSIRDAGVLEGGRGSIIKIQPHPTKDVALLELDESVGTLGDASAWRYTEEHLTGRELKLAGFCNETGSLDCDLYHCSSYEDKYKWYILRSGVDPGMSGGPAILDGRLAGIIRAATKTGSSARIIPFRAFKELLAEFGLLSSDSSPESKTSPPSAAPKQIPLQPIDLIGYEDRFRRDLKEAFSNKRLQPAARVLCDNLTKVSSQDAVDELLKSNDALDAVKKWNGVIAKLLHDSGFDQSALRNVWSVCEKVHLLLLPRLVNYKWLAACKQDGDDQMLFSLSIRHDPPNRVVDLLFASLDEDSAIRFEHRGNEEERDIAVPEKLIDVTNEGLHHSSTPDPTRAVERIGLYLWVKYKLGKPPEIMHAEHWKKLDAMLTTRQDTNLLYYLIIPEGDHYANEAILQGLYNNMPNLPKFLLLASSDSLPPFDCDPIYLSAAISAFWHMKPT